MPLSQMLHVVPPTTSLKDPAVQSEHTVRPSMAAIFPTELTTAKWEKKKVGN